MRSVLVLVEGQTEERFIKQVLQPHLASREVWATPTVLRTSGFRQPVRKGGGSSWFRMRRLERFLSGYRKTLHGPACASDIGLEVLRARCPHFGEWLSWLESLGQ